MSQFCATTQPAAGDYDVLCRGFVFDVQYVEYLYLFLKRYSRQSRTQIIQFMKQ